MFSKVAPISQLTVADVATELSTSEKNLRYHAARSPASKYVSFNIKAKGKSREIFAPDKTLKQLQRRLLVFLENRYEPRNSTCGFIKGGGIHKNAVRHVGRRFVLNLDLANFFPTITLQRVIGLLQSQPFNLDTDAARVMARICCNLGVLPQGAPTSPIISNAICFRLDKLLQNLASRRGCRYSRYADDITFSSNRPFGHEFIATLQPEIELSELLVGIILKEGFKVNESKTRLRTWYQRQVVTGLVVNSKVNVKREYEAKVRGMLHAWDKYGEKNAEQVFHAKYDKKHRYPSHLGQFRLVALGHLAYIRSIVGPDSPCFRRLIDIAVKADPSLGSLRSDARSKLVRMYDDAKKLKPIPRGIKLEKILNELLRIEAIYAEKSFDRHGRSEQIDGAFQLDSHLFIAECKWHKEEQDLATCDVLSMKAQRGGSTVFGLLISMSGWSKHVEDGLKRNPSKNVLLMDVDDFEACLSGDVSFRDLVAAKLRYLAFYGEAFMPWKSFVPR